MSKHVTCVELAINSFHFVVSVLQFLLQPAVPDVQMLHSSYTSLVTKCSCDIRICVQDDWQKTNPEELKIVLRQLGFFPQLADAHDFAFSIAQCVLSSRLVVAVKSTTTVKYPPDAGFLSMSSQAHSPPRYASMLSALPDLGMKVAKSFVPLMYLTILINCLNDFRFGSLSLLAHPSRCGFQVWPAPRRAESCAHW